MKNDKFQRLKTFVSNLKKIWDTSELAAEIYNLAAEQLITSAQEKDLYSLLNPADDMPSPAELFSEGERCIALYAYSLNL